MFDSSVGLHTGMFSDMMCMVLFLFLFFVCMGGGGGGDINLEYVQTVICNGILEPKHWLLWGSIHWGDVT